LIGGFVQQKKVIVLARKLTTSCRSGGRNTRNRNYVGQRGKDWAKVYNDGRRQVERDPIHRKLCPAVDKSDLQAVRKLLSENSDTEVKYKDCSPLMYAAGMNFTDIIIDLLDWNADMTATNHKGRAALNFAAAPSMIVRRRLSCASSSSH
jgi:hypothetical protein